MLLGKDVRPLRLKMGLNQKQFADLVGTRESRVSEWENKEGVKISPAYEIIIRQKCKLKE